MQRRSARLFQPYKANDAEKPRTRPQRVYLDSDSEKENADVVVEKEEVSLETPLKRLTRMKIDSSKKTPTRVAASANTESPSRRSQRLNSNVQDAKPVMRLFNEKITENVLKQEPKITPIRIRKNGDGEYRVVPKSKKRQSESESEDYSSSEESSFSSGSASSIASSVSQKKPRKSAVFKQKASTQGFRKPAAQVLNKFGLEDSDVEMDEVSSSDSPLEEIRRCLHASRIPETLPCREEQYAQIENFIRIAIAPRSESGSLYISGVPGTGKTATVRSVIRRLHSEKKAPEFIDVYVNAMELAEPRTFFSIAYRQIFGNEKKVGAIAARRKLNSVLQLRDAKRPPIIILVDELDYMVTKRQDILYDVLNWTTNEKARITVIGIANTLDLPERELSARVSSRLGTARVCFHPYTHNQIEQIIRQRLSGSDAVDSKAIEMASRKVAALSGDLRKAIDFLRRAAEISLEQGGSQLKMEHVVAAITESQATLRAAYSKSLSPHCFYMFKAAVHHVQSRGVEEFSFLDLWKQYKMMNRDRVSETLAKRLVTLLHSLQLIVLCPVTKVRNNWLFRKMRLGVSLQEGMYLIQTREDLHKVS